MATNRVPEDGTEPGSARFRMFHSIRTKYSVATALFLLFVLTVFYVGGRIVLVHMMRDAESRIKTVGADISGLLHRQAELVRRAAATRVAPALRQIAAGRSFEDLLRELEPGGFAMVAEHSAAAGDVCGAFWDGAEPGRLERRDLLPYAARLDAWRAGLDPSRPKIDTVGLVRLVNRTYYVTLAVDPALPDRTFLFGVPFDFKDFSAQVKGNFQGIDIRFLGTMPSPAAAPAPAAARSGAEENPFGLVPMIAEAMNFYSGGFWNLDEKPLLASFSVRDIAGEAVTTISLRLPKSLSSVTHSALGRLTFFIAMAGILLVLPLFWVQARVLLNPLTKMTEAVRALGRGHLSTDCPRLEWKGKDEFATLASSVNRMLETISARTVELAQMESRQRALIDGVPDALAVFDRRGRLAAVTKQPVGVPPLPGFTVGEAPSAEVYGTMGAVAFASAVSRVFDDSLAQNVRLKVQRPSGVSRAVTTRHFEVRVSRMDEFFALAIIRDVTQEVAEHKLRLSAEQRALDSSKRESLTVLAAGIAHDVNNVLSVILSTAEAALADAARDEVRAEMDVIRDAVRRGSAMTKELMTYAGETKIQLVRAKPGLIVKDVQMLAERVIGRNVSLDYALDESAPDVDVDAGQFWKVLFNIVKNAGEALGTRPGRITLSTEAYEMTREEAANFVSERPLEPGRGVMFRIADDGPGIPPELLPRLFDPYVSSKSLGRGLGLATVRTIVESHGGGIKVTSALDQGTTFHIWLPESRMPEEPAPTEEARAHEEGELPAEVLVVDNEEAILKTSSILLKALKITPHVAHDRSESLGIMRRRARQIGAILLDANLGGIDTVRLLEAFRIVAPRTPVIVSSGSNEDSLRKMFESHPFDAFLGKPYTIAELKDVLVKCRRG